MSCSQVCIVFYQRNPIAYCALLQFEVIDGNGPSDEL
jgi:hypothetical protein